MNKFNQYINTRINNVNNSYNSNQNNLLNNFINRKELSNLSNKTSITKSLIRNKNNKKNYPTFQYCK